MRIRNGWLDAWAERGLDIEEVVDRDDDVVASLHITARGRGSGVQVDVRLHGHFKVRDGKVSYLFEHEDRAKALEAAGLVEEAMSRENVDVVRAAFDAWNAGDMDALRELYHADAISRGPEDWPEPGAAVGREAVMRQFEQLRGTWDADAFELISDFIDVGDRVAVRYVWGGVGHGPELRLGMTSVCTVRKRRIVGVEFFWDHAEALKTLGLADG